MATPPPAAGGAYVSQNMGETMEEARMELRQLSFKISKCEIALESHGSYLGITDPVRKGETDRQTAVEPFAWKKILLSQIVLS